jgi:hypothetical protein
MSEQTRESEKHWSVVKYVLAAEQATTALKAVRGAKWQVFVTKITLSITTHADAKVAVTVQSSNATPVVIATRTDKTAAAGVPDVITWDFGHDGVSVAVGESLNYLSSTGGSGPVSVLYAEGYERLGAISDLSVANTAN